MTKGVYTTRNKFYILWVIQYDMSGEYYN